MKEMDEKYQVAEKTKSALAVAERTVSTAGSAIMSDRYVLTGAAWVTGAYNKVATTATDVSAKAKDRMMAEQEGEHVDDELAKTHLHESFEAAEHQEGDSARNFILESPEMCRRANIKRVNAKLLMCQITPKWLKRSRKIRRVKSQWPICRKMLKYLRRSLSTMRLNH
uniref:Uncharacterized protein n=1 Tax=Arundo donax TaxID=35708 RepID=A0A0A8XP87_ARUDO